MGTPASTQSARAKGKAKPAKNDPTAEPAPVSAVEATSKPARRATAETMASRQREISVSEFFTKNRHLLGFDNPAKALLTTVKEAVDNALDACEEAGILPDIIVEITDIGEGRFRVAVEDNGPGIVKPQIPKIFAKLLYGSKFHRLKQSRGQQGIGISAAGLYGQLTTGRPVVITSTTGKGRPSFRIELRIDTKRNQPDVVKDETIDWEGKTHGTRVEIELVAAYRGGRTGVDAYLEQTVVTNPHMSLLYVTPKGERRDFPRVSNELPREAQEIKPHPHGVELGMLLNMLQDSSKKTVKQVLTDDFSRVSPAVAEKICEIAGVKSKTKAGAVSGPQVDALHKALGEVKVMAPPATCVVPVGEALLVEGLKRRFPAAEFYASTTRPPAVYRGNPFVVEVAVAYGGDLASDEPADVMRFANRVPLQYQPKACAISESVYDTNWRAYEMQQPKGALPIGPLAVVVHLASVWVPFTSEAKEAVAHYDDLLKEMRLALQECGRKLAAHIRARARAESQMKRLGIFQRYIPEVAAAMATILGGSKEKIEGSFKKALPRFVHVAEEKPAVEEKAPTPTTPPPPPDSMPPPALDEAAPAVSKAKGKAPAAKASASESKAPAAKGKTPAAKAPAAKGKTPAAKAPAKKGKAPAVKAPAKKGKAPAAKAPAKKGKAPAVKAPAKKGNTPAGKGKAPANKGKPTKGEQLSLI
ncbi:MAG: DNA topoisomerase VI subunit B [Polyangiaceae bacterium]